MLFICTAFGHLVENLMLAGIMGNSGLAQERENCEVAGLNPAPACLFFFLAGLPRAKRAWSRAPYSWNMVNLFSFGCHVTDRAYVRTSVRTYASTDCTGRVGETIKRKGGVSQACLGKSTYFILDIHNMVN